MIRGIDKQHTVPTPAAVDAPSSGPNQSKHALHENAAAVVTLQSTNRANKQSEQESTTTTYENLKNHQIYLHSDDLNPQQEEELQEDFEFHELKNSETPGAINLDPIPDDPMGTVVKMVRARRKVLSDASKNPQQYWTAAQATLEMAKARTAWIQEILGGSPKPAAPANRNQAPATQEELEHPPRSKESQLHALGTEQQESDIQDRKGMPKG